MRRQETRADGSPVTSQRTSKLSPRRTDSRFGVNWTAREGAPFVVERDFRNCHDNDDDDE